MSRLLRKLLSALWWLSVSLIIIVAVLLGAARLILPSLGGYRGEVEVWLSDYLQQQVSVDHLDLRWQRLGPQLTLAGLQVVDPDDGRTLFAIDTAYLDTDIWSLFRAGERGVLRDVELAGLTLQLDIGEDDSVSLQQLELWRPGASERSNDRGDLFAALAAPRSVSLSDVTLSVRDIRHDTEHVLRGGAVRLENDGKRVGLQVELPLPATLGRHLSASMHMPIRDDGARGRMYVALSDFQLGRWGGLLRDLPVQIASGQLDGEIWLDWTPAGVSDVQMRLAGREFSLIRERDAARVAHWRAESLAAEIQWHKETGGWRLQVDDLRYRPTPQRAWPGSALLLSMREGEADPVWRGSIDYLELEDLASLAQFAEPLLPFQLPAELAALRPGGIARDVRFEVAGAELADARVQSRFSGVTTRASGGFPGVAGIAGSLQLAGGSGQATLNSNGVTLELPRLFREPLRLDRIAGDLGVDLREGVTLWSPLLQVANDDLQTSNRIRLRWRADTPLELDLQTRFRDGNGAATSRYLPVGVMPDALVQWLDEGIVGGNVTQGTALFYGDPFAFPFRAGDGVFQVGFDVRDAHVRYQPDWPPAREVDAHVRFEQASLNIEARTGEIGEGSIEQARVRFDDLEAGILVLDGVAAADLQAGLDFLRATPLRSDLAPLVDNFRGRGPTNVGISVVIPIEDVERFELSGTIDLQRAAIRAEQWNLDFAELQGRVAFDQNGFWFDDVKGLSHGQPANLQAVARQGFTQVSMQGRFSARELLGERLSELSARVEGRSDWQVEVDVPVGAGAGSELRVRASSSLTGSAVALPAPAGKTALSASPVRVAVDIGASATRVNVTYGQWLGMDLVLEQRPDGELSFVRGLVVSEEGPAVAPNEPGLVVRLTVPELDIDGWLEVYRQLQATGGEQSLRHLTLRTDAARVNDRDLGALAATLLSTQTNWVLGIQNQFVTGSIDLPKNPTRLVPMRIALKKLDLGALRGEGDSSVAELTLAPQDFPPLQVSIDELLMDTLQLKKVELRGEPRASALHLEQISFDNGVAVLTGNGVWRTSDAGQQHSRVEFRVESDDWGKALALMGYPQTLREGSGYIAGALSWPGGIYQPVLARTQGNVRVRLKDGWLIGADPGLGRFVGLFSLQALPRRLALDFKDFLVDGFEFDRIRGTLELREGRAYSRKMEMRGIVGEVALTGSSDLVAQTYQQKIIVTPDLSASLPLVGELAVPGSGVTILLVGAILRTVGVDIERIGRLQYTLTGPWEDPVFEKIVSERPDEPQDRSR